MKNLWLSVCTFLLVGACLGQASADKVLVRHARAMMIDMRGTPDLLGECRGAGFFRNNTDCTQFYRCVDFHNKSIYTIFRFMCGPMAVFDESRSLCTGPELAVPPCPSDQLQVFLANNMMSMKPGTPHPKPPPTRPSTLPPIPIIKPTPTPPRPTPPRPTPPRPTVQPPPPPIPVVKPTTTTTTTLQSATATSISTSESVITIPGPVTTTVSIVDPLTTSVEITVPVVEPTATSIIEPTTITTVLSTLITSSLVTSVSTVEPLIITSVSSVDPLTVTVVSTIELQTVTQVSTQEASTVTLTSTVAPSTVTILSTIEQPAVTILSSIEPVTITLTSTLPPATVTITSTIGSAVVTMVSTMAPVVVTQVTETTLVETATEVVAPTSTVIVTPTETSTEPPVITTEPPPPQIPLVGVVPIGCDDPAGQTSSDVPIRPDSLLALVPSGPNGQLTVTLDGGASNTYQIPPGSIVGITTTTDGGSVSSVTSGVCAGSSTTLVVPAGSTIAIYRFDGMRIILYKTIVVTVTQVTIVFSPSGVIGHVQFGQQGQIVTIGTATFTVHYFLTITGTAAYGLLQVSYKPSTALTVTTGTLTLLDDPESLIAILPFGGSPSSPVDIDVPEGSTLGVVPHQGLGTVTVTGATSTNTFNVQPGSLLVVTAVGGSGKVTAVVNQFLTSSSTTITFPAGSVFAIVRITVGGVIYRIENRVVTTEQTTVVVPAQSLVGILQTLQGWQIVGFGAATFETKYITNIVSTGTQYTGSFIGVLNLSGDSGATTATTTTVTSSPETLVGVLKVGESDALGVDGEPVKSTSDLSVPQGSVLAVVPPRQNVPVTFTEQGTSTTLVLPAGTVLGIQSGSGSGVVSGVSNGFFTSSSTSITFPAGSTLFIYVVGTGGRVVYQQLLFVTKYVITVTVPVSSTVGILGGQNAFDSIGGAVFSVEYLAVSPTNHLAAFGVVFAGSSSTGSQQVVTSNAPVTGDSQSVSGILQVGKPVTSTSVTKLSVPVGSTVAIVPTGGRGEIVVAQNDSTINSIDISPGHVVGIKVSIVGGTISGIAQNLFTTNSSAIHLPAGTEVHLYKVGVQGQLISIQVITTTSTSTILAPLHSVVGFVSFSDSGAVTSIGSASYSTQLLTQTVGSSSGSSSGSVYFGVLNLSSGSQIITYSSDTISGTIHLASELVLFPPSPATTSAISIPINVPAAIVAAEGVGEMVVSEEEASLLNTTTFAINSGSVLIVSTSTSPGTATDIAGGYLTTDATSLNFPAGGTFGIATLWKNATITIANSITTQGKTTITVPKRSTFGFLSVNENGRVTEIGPASFTTQYMTVSASSNADSVNFLGSVGILHFKQDFKASESAMVTSVAFGHRQTISGIIQIGVDSLTGTDSDTFASTVDINAAAGSTVGVIPFKGQGLVTVSTYVPVCRQTGCSEAFQPTDFFAVLPGRLFVVSVSPGAQGKITSLGGGFFTTPATVMTFEAGTTFGVASIGADGQLHEMESSVTSSSKILVVVPLASTVGLVERQSSIVSSIGGASFFIRYANSSFAQPSALGILDIDSVLNPPATTTESPTVPPTESPTESPTEPPTVPPTVPPTAPPTPPPKPGPSGAFTIDCSDGLHRYPYDCSRFYQCYGEGEEQTVYVFSCAAGLMFDEATSECTTPAQTTCDIVSSNLTSSFGGGFQISCGSDALLRYPLNCNFFYQCFKDGQDETIFVFSCAADLVFDEASAQCVTPEETQNCSVSENIIKTVPFFQLGQSIDIRQYVRRVGIDQHAASASVVRENKPKLSRLTADESPQAVVDAVSSLVGKLAKQYHSGATHEQQPTGGKSDTLPHLFQYRKVQPGAYGTRVVPRMRQLYGQQHDN